jgi:hypothetical protein
VRKKCAAATIQSIHRHPNSRSASIGIRDVISGVRRGVADHGEPRWGALWIDTHGIARRTVKSAASPPRVVGAVAETVSASGMSFAMFVEHPGSCSFARLGN